MLGDMRIKLGPVTVEESGVHTEPGRIEVERSVLRVGTGSDPILLGQIQPPGKKAMAAADWARGARLEPGVWAT
jgi:methionyl-tRNA formyltransferase